MADFLVQKAMKLPTLGKRKNRGDEDAQRRMGGPIHQERNVKIICIGAGASGLLFAYKIQRHFENFDLTIYEKNSEVSGTWWENKYPGCACDVPSHNYTWYESNDLVLECRTLADIHVPQVIRTQARLVSRLRWIGRDLRLFQQLRPQAQTAQVCEDEASSGRCHLGRQALRLSGYC